jgi:hypothetical protein
MGRKTIAIIHGDDGRKYRVRKWNDEYSTLCAEYGRPGQIEVLDADSEGWNHLSWWSAADDFGNLPDDEVMEEALNRLDVAFDVEPEKIIYDQCRERKQIEPDGVAVAAL